MRQVRGTESIFYIKHEGIWCPVACETSSGMSEQTEMISTTTRDNGGWKTEKPTLQGYSHSVSGVLVNELPSFDYYGRNLLLNSEQPTWNPNDTGKGTSVKMEDATGKFTRTTPDAGKVVSVYGHYYADFESGKFSHSMYVRHFHSSNVTIWAQSIPPNVWTWIKDEAYSNSNGWNGYTSDTPNVAIDTKKFKLEKGAVATPYSIAPEEQKILSYFKLRQKKRNRELIEWKRETLGGRYIDSGRAYITDISDENPVDDMMAFTMTLSGFGKPDFVADDSVIVAEAFANYNDDLVANSNNQILEP